LLVVKRGLWVYEDILLIEERGLAVVPEVVELVVGVAVVGKGLDGGERVGCCREGAIEFYEGENEDEKAERGEDDDNNERVAVHHDEKQLWLLRSCDRPPLHASVPCIPPALPLVPAPAALPCRP
jgi:hypothetical protein